MNIGTAIKILRKKKGFSQKDLSRVTGLSVNALSLIETNATFPQKNTLKSICKAIGIPLAYLLMFSITDDDIPEEKRPVFHSLSSAIKSILLDDIQKSN